MLAGILFGFPTNIEAVVIVVMLYVRQYRKRNFKRRRQQQAYTLKHGVSLYCCSRPVSGEMGDFDPACW